MATRSKTNQIEKQFERHVLVLLWAVLSFQRCTRADSRGRAVGKTLIKLNLYPLFLWPLIFYKWYLDSVIPGFYRMHPHN